MSSTRIRRSEPCAHENCGSRRFHVGNDGYTYCDQGHQQSERGTVIADADNTGEFAVLGRKTKRRDSSDAESRTSRASGFSGADAFEHYLLCIQLVLRKQLRWLIEVQKLPGELEVLVKDLWALRLQKLQNKISYESETDTEGPSSQVFSSQSESERERSSRSRSRRRDDMKPKEGAPNLLEMTSLSYLAISLLRIPVTVADMHGWINNGEMLYYQASREVPLGMRERLPSRYQQLLVPQDMLPPENLHQSVLETLTRFNKDFGMVIPPLNVSLVLYRWVKDLALPLEVFAASQRLAKTLDVNAGSFTASKGVTNVVLRYPEAQLMALLVVATKLLFPFDNIDRQCRAATELSALSLDWDAWAKMHIAGDSHSDQKQLTFQHAFELTESECLAAGNDKLDAYLDWYEDNIASEDVREHGQAGKDADFRKTLFRMFPGRSEERTGQQAHDNNLEAKTVDNLRQVQGTLLHGRAVRPLDSQDCRRIGSLYRRFRNVEDLSGPVEVFFGKAAKLAGLSMESMVQAVFLTERKVQKVEEALRKSGHV